MRFGFVTLQPFPHQLINQLLVFAALHIDEIADDEPADVPQSQLARNFIRCLQIGLKDCLFDIAGTFVASSVHVDGDKRGVRARRRHS